MLNSTYIMFMWSISLKIERLSSCLFGLSLWKKNGYSHSLYVCYPFSWHNLEVITVPLNVLASSNLICMQAVWASSDSSEKGNLFTSWASCRNPEVGYTFESWASLDMTEVGFPFNCWASSDVTQKQFLHFLEGLTEQAALFWLEKKG